MSNNKQSSGVPRKLLIARSKKEVYQSLILSQDIAEVFPVWYDLEKR